MKSNFKIKLSKDGRAMLNLGCGSCMHNDWNNIDFSLYAYLRHHMVMAKFLTVIGFLSNERFEKLERIDPDILRFDITKGIPFPSSTFDIVYHSQFLEHLDRNYAPIFLQECYRVLKQGGIMRVVVPDLKKLVSKYNEAVSGLSNGDISYMALHEQAINNLFEQMVRDEPVGTSRQRYIVRKFEKLIRGNAKVTGELHKWMYDEYSLKKLLSLIGFKDIVILSARNSNIYEWTKFYLDIDQNGKPYHDDSLYIEGAK
jgi:predicted SAM-dependent methyltransferase